MSYPPFADLVPHGGPMVLLDALTDWEPGRAEARGRVRAKTPYVDSNGLETVLMVEHMAQGVAACLGYEAFQGGNGVRVGMIIACKKLEARVPRLAIDTDYKVRVERVRGSDALSHFNTEVVVADEVAATAVLTLIHAEKPPED